MNTKDISLMSGRGASSFTQYLSVQRKMMRLCDEGIVVIDEHRQSGSFEFPGAVRTGTESGSTPSIRGRGAESDAHEHHMDQSAI